MRITNKVMQNNALSNINRNKNLQDDLNNQIATGKKIMKPSDDPVVAIRALRLRSDVSQVNQYYQKNIPDAQAWLSLTETSLKTTIDVVKSTVSECERGASDHLQTSDRDKIISSLKALRDEIYKTGDADYAGRYIFTGFRTDTALSFGKETTRAYEITQTFNFDDCEKMNYIDTANLNEITEANYDDGSHDIAETDIENRAYYRFRLAYDELDKSGPLELFSRPKAEDPDAKTAATGIPSSVPMENDKDAAYTAASTNDDYIAYIPSTGELVMGKNVYNAINNLPEEDKNLNVVYKKSNWQSTDLRPEHYFYCKADNEKDAHEDPTDPTSPLIRVEYNPDYRFNLAKSPDQRIEYQVGFDQSVQVNSYASDVYKHAIGRDVDEIIQLAEEVSKAENMVKQFKTMQDDVSYDQDKVAVDLAAAQKAETFLKDKLQKTFSKYITKCQGYLDDANEAVTVCGNRDKRVSLAENRLSDQQTTFKTLQSENEDADATEVAVQLSSAEVSYEAALMATGKMIQTTLLNYL
ncbi:MAG: flagellar hook-associated protein FlgL [Lachnospiraceae bacterium]|nr:flagellar hook-associated protein FlgL [Lachnospiraceae bacterium]